MLTRLDFVYDLLITVHLLGMAAVLGGVYVDRTARDAGLSRPTLIGAVAQVLTGLALTGIASAGLVGVSVDNTKVAVKLTVAVTVLALVLAASRLARDLRPRVLLAAGVLVVANVGVAALW